MKKIEKMPPRERYTPTVTEGLTDKEVMARMSEGQVNVIPNTTAKSYKSIFIENICTFFNLIWAIIFAVNLVVMLVRPDLFKLGNLFFILVIIANTGLAIIQEIRAKIQLERLTMVTAPRITAIRDGRESELLSEEIVLDDILVLTVGNQIPADCILLSGKVEMNESLLTGESDGVKKEAGDTLYAGSFIIAGGCRARVDKVGADSYIQTVAGAAKAFKTPASDLFRDITRFIRVIGICIIPFALIMYFSNYRALGDVARALLATAGSIQGMIPAGMFLLITVALSVGVIKLAVRNKTQVKDIYSVEMLARTNMLCLDKTGTITDGTMRVVSDRALLDGFDIARAVYGIMHAQNAQNFTSDALLQHYKKDVAPTAVYNIPFSSKRKFTATSFDDGKTYAIGAPEFLNVGALPTALADEIAEHARNGQRVLLVAVADGVLTEDTLPPMTPAAVVVLADHIRPEAPDTIRWFRENGVSVKIISGDNPVTVAGIAKRVGVENADKCISLDGMSDEAVADAADKYTVFGRVSPEQKHILVTTLKSLGYTVAMTGDGVNDTLALKEADCSIAMMDGSDVARDLSKIVLLDNNFASLPSVVREGRQVVNNVQRASSLFLMKTFSIITLSVVCVLFGIPYFFETGNLTMLEVLVTGLPSVVLALEPNNRVIEGSFLREVLRKCVPDALLIILSTASVVVMHHAFGMFPDVSGVYSAEYTSMLTLALTFAGFINLAFLCFPMTKVRLATVGCSLLGLIVCVAVLGANFGVAVVTPTMWLILGVQLVCLIPLHLLLAFAWKKLSALLSTKKKKKA